MRSVHREWHRPQGGLYPPKAIQPRKKVEMWLATFLTMRKPICCCASLASTAQATGVQERGMCQEKWQELARPHWFPVLFGVGATNRKKVAAMTNGESDPFIVLRDGSAVHLGKGLAEWWNWIRKQVSNA
jgi:hypothetical protein